MKNIEDFLTHPEFIRWVGSPDKELEAYWREWSKANPELVPHMRVAKEFLIRTRFSPTPPPKGLKEALLKEVLRQPSSTQIRKPKDQVDNRGLGVRNFWRDLGQMNRVAAILVISLGLGWLLSPLTELDQANEVIPVTELIVKATGPGERLQLTFGDGSKIWMNSSSEVIFPEKFGSDKREIQLRGEAYFEVVKDSLRPFKVVTEGVTTTVLGTSFNIDSRDTNRINISLLSGKVQVSASEADVTLSPGEMLAYQQENSRHKVSVFDPEEVLAWKDGVLLFHRASLPQVKASLEEWYGVQIHLQNTDSVAWQFSGEYRQQMLEEVLESMSYIQGFNYKIESDQVTIIF